MKKIITFALFEEDFDCLHQCLQSVIAWFGGRKEFSKRLSNLLEHLNLSRCDHDLDAVLMSLFEGGVKK